MLSGSLNHLGPSALLRLLGATAPSGVLELLTDAGALRLEIVRGRVRTVTDRELSRAGRILRCDQGAFSFEPQPMDPLAGESVALATFADVASAKAWPVSGVSPDLVLEEILGVEALEAQQSRGSARIHMLPAAPPDNPLDELLAELEENAPGELLFGQVGVVATDPRVWRGTLEPRWRRRGWQLRLYGSPEAVTIPELDALLVHHQLSITRVGQEDEWVSLVSTASAMASPIPVVWIGPLGDPVWVHRLIEAGASFLMPAPQGDSGETLHRFVDDVTAVVDRQLGASRELRRPELPGAVSDLVDTLLHEADSEQAIGSLLQLAAGQLLRGLLLVVEETAIRCRAGFGYPLDRGGAALPRGVGLLERVGRSGEPEIGIDPDAAGAVELAKVVGVDRLPAATALIPLGRGSHFGGILVADREGQPLPDLGELVLLAQRFGGLVVGA